MYSTREILKKLVQLLLCDYMPMDELFKELERIELMLDEEGD